MEPVVFDVRLTRKDYNRLYLWAGYVRGYRIATTILAILISAALLFLLILSLALRLSGLDSMLIVLFALPSVIMLLVLISILVTSGNAYRNSGAAREGHRYEIKPHEIVEEGTYSKNAITPDAIKKIYYKKRYIYITLTGNRFFIIPKAAIPADKFETVERYIENLG